MTLYLHYKGDDDRHWKTKNLDVEPCLTVTAAGLTGGSYHLEESETETRVADEKPPYRVPTMAEIAKVPWNGMTVVSTFAGAGGSSLGYRMAGFRVLWASEFIEAARDVYRANARKGTILDERDIRQVDPLEVLRALDLKVGELDVLDGSPPCASFSTAGKREKHWGEEKAYSDTKQRTDDLFFEYIRFLRAMQPRVFVAENVSGLVKGVAKGYFLEVLRAMKSCGYRVEARLLDAQWLGVPQQRQRIIFVGVRKDLREDPAFPKPLPYRYSVRDALPWLSRVEQGPQGNGWNKGKEIRGPSPSILATQSLCVMVEGRVMHDTGRTGSQPHDITDVPSPTITVGAARARDGGGVRNHFKVVTKKGARSADLPAPTVMQHGRRGTQSELTIEPETDIESQAIGREYDKLNPGQSSDKYFNLVRSDAAAPAPTITASGGMNSGIACAVHPSEKRKFAIAELKRICGFPDDFVLTGTYAQQWERLGRAVPPPMMFRIATAVREMLARAPARTPARARRSLDRSTSGSARKGAATKRTRPPSAARTGTPAA